MIKMTCAECGGENVMRDAWAEWDVPSQSWTLQTTFDAAHCDDCDGECSIEEEPADDMAPDPGAVREAFRQAVLDALDTTAARTLRVHGVHTPGASDGDLPALFRAIDAHADTLAARYGVRGANDSES